MSKRSWEVERSGSFCSAQPSWLLLLACSSSSLAIGFKPDRTNHSFLLLILLHRRKRKSFPDQISILASPLRLSPPFSQSVPTSQSVWFLVFNSRRRVCSNFRRFCFSLEVPPYAYTHTYIFIPRVVLVSGIVRNAFHFVSLSRQTKKKRRRKRGDKFNCRSKRGIGKELISCPGKGKKIRLPVLISLTTPIQGFAQLFDFIWYIYILYSSYAFASDRLICRGLEGGWELICLRGLGGPRELSYITIVFPLVNPDRPIDLFNLLNLDHLSCPPPLSFTCG